MMAMALNKLPARDGETGRLNVVVEQRLAEIVHFFVAYNEIEGREFKVLRRCGAEEAEAKLNSALID